MKITINHRTAFRGVLYICLFSLGVNVAQFKYGKGDSVQTLILLICSLLLAFLLAVEEE